MSNLDKLISHFEKFPGIGGRQGLRNERQWRDHGVPRHAAGIRICGREQFGRILLHHAGDCGRTNLSAHGQALVLP